jgi:hypothetical protein
VRYSEFDEAVGHQNLRRVLSYRGAWQKAEQELAISTKYRGKPNDYDGLCIDGCHRGLLFMLSKNHQKALAEYLHYKASPDQNRLACSVFKVLFTPIKE